MLGSVVVSESNGNNVTYYHYDGNSILIGFNYNGKEYSYLRDLIGKIYAIIDSKGKKVVQYRYTAFGAIESEEVLDDGFDPECQSYLYKGYYYDRETGLYYLNSRYYDPEVGRFISADDVDYLDIASIHGLNLYAYCGNNPIMFVDDCGNHPTPISVFGNVIQGFLDGMGKYLSKSTEGMGLTLQQAKKLARKGGHVQSARSIMRGREDDIAESFKMSKALKTVAKWTSRALLVIDIGSSWVNNYNSGSSAWISDSLVDTGYSLFKYGVGYVAFSVCMFIPGVGWIIGIGLCIGLEFGLDHFLEDKIVDIKNWASDVGRNIEKGWNQFWSFNWI